MIENLLHELGQTHLNLGIEHLTSEQLQTFFFQLQKYSALLPAQRQLLGKKIVSQQYTPWSQFTRSGNSQDQSLGAKLIRQKKVGCLILAGGQASRLGLFGPKGTIPVLGKKSLFQVFCERAQGPPKGPLCIMTSPCNHEQTEQFFKDNSYFNLAPSQLFFFSQEMLPFLDDQGNWILEEPGCLAMGPDGNGHALNLFFESGIWKRWAEMGIEYLNVIFVDNALADPFDAEFVGLTARTKVDAALKAIDRLPGDSSMGALMEKEGKLKIVEYSEMLGDSEALLSNTGMFCIAMTFIPYLAQEIKAQFPLHLARKKFNQGAQEVWKCERFLFDLLEYVRSSAVLVYPREQIYAPLKNATGDKSIDTVRSALSRADTFKF